ncbi:quinone oxidoreductase [Komagataeibacter xylinus E25]|nr:quinone oxidoreductase [Komagataeibacter xylinus E25]
MAKVIRIHENGGPSVLRVENAEVGAPGPGEVRLIQQAIGINFVDGMIREGNFPLPPPTIPGFEAAGIVESVGPGVSDFAPGERVGYFFIPGAYATERDVPTAPLIHLPEDISTETSAVFLVKGLTAWMGLRPLHHLAADETALVLGASGGVGSVLSRWARALGAKVIGVAGSASKMDIAEAGSDHALLAGDPQIVEKIRAIAPKGVDVVYDLVGAATFEVATATIRDGGTIATIGAASGQPQPLSEDLVKRGVEVKGGGVPQLIQGPTAATATSELWTAIRDGVFADLHVVRYPFADIVRAHEDMAHRRFEGLPVLIV